MFRRFRDNFVFKRESIIASVLLLNTFSWFFIGQKIIAEVVSTFNGTNFESFCLGLVYPISIIASAIIGSVYMARVHKTILFYIWIIFGIIASILPAALSDSLPIALIINMLIGISLGLGLPSCLTFFSNSVPIENRGKAGGTILLLATFCAPLITIATSTLDLATTVIVFAAWRGWSLPILFLMPKKGYRQTVDRKPFSLVSIFQNRTFVLYFVAWSMFSLVDGFEGLVLAPRIGEFRFLMTIMEPIFAGISALAAGMFSDWVGRKRVLIFGFVSLGVAYAIIGLASQIWIAWVFYFIMDGIALGLLWVLFVIVIWGDLSKLGIEKYYAVGQIPFFLTPIASLLLAPYIALIPEASAFSLAAFFLFIAVIPLLYAPETLPEKKIQERQLRIYTEEALKLKQKARPP